MSLCLHRSAFIVLALPVLIPLEAATVQRQGADEFDRKIALIQRQGDISDGAGTRRTQVTEAELNNWFMYRAQPLLPDGVGQPQVSMVGDGRLTGRAVVDLDAVAKRRSTGGRFDPFSLIGGKVPVSVTGILHTRDGMARFEAQAAEMSGIPVPVAVLQELATHYSRTPERPQGVRLDDAFALPAGILQVEVGQGQAVVVQ
ncbi:MAG: hypothetical protein HW394_114 [Acidobacteria bacterium]|nr:hypothetical protein [Acidobacteriota bacterium]